MMMISVMSSLIWSRVLLISQLFLLFLKKFLLYFMLFQIFNKLAEKKDSNLKDMREDDEMWNTLTENNPLNGQQPARSSAQPANIQPQPPRSTVTPANMRHCDSP